METPRSSGILMHPTSLPGTYGIGTFDQNAVGWVDLLADCYQTLWQVLPLGPTGYGDSPYQSFSTFAGNPYLISLQALLDEGMLKPEDLEDAPDFPADRVDYGAIYRWKLPLLQRAAERIDGWTDSRLRHEFDEFCLAESEWLDDYALFMTLKDLHDGASWSEWPMPLRSRENEALAKILKEEADRVRYHKFMQWLFFRQWEALKTYANEKGIRIVGDIPIYVAMDSADVWTNPELFFLNEELHPTVVAGVPPDYFSATGQLWGNPIYRWERMAENGYKWWIDRIQASLRLYDIVRIDHFRGFANYWEVPAGEETAIHGRWVDGPGADLFEKILAELGELPIIAEDLGLITESVIELRDQFELPGMKILQFAFSTDGSDKFLPHNFGENFVVYSGTHDNDTSVGWYRNSSSEHERDHFRRYFRSDGSQVHWSLIEGAFSSVARYAIVPLQDILGLDSDARMNLPGRASGNWQWRYQEGMLDGETIERFKEITLLYGRDPSLYEGKGKEAGGQ